MAVLTSHELTERLNHGDEKSRLVITPILDPQVQVGLCSVDLRLGTRFQVDLRTRDPYISLDGNRPVRSFFDETYRDFGEPFILYPGQLVLACTFEYLRLPYDVAGHLASRSSLNRLGISFYSLVQPGYAGTLTFELTNSTSNPIALMPGMRIAQLQLHLLHGALEDAYASVVTSKYVGSTGPKVSSVSLDVELAKLGSLHSKHQVRV